MARLFRLLLLGLVLAAWAAGCTKEPPRATAPPPKSGPEGKMDTPKLIPLPK
jgi:hypothetical protein